MFYCIGADRIRASSDRSIYQLNPNIDTVCLFWANTCNLSGESDHTGLACIAVTCSLCKLDTKLF